MRKKLRKNNHILLKSSSKHTEEVVRETVGRCSHVPWDVQHTRTTGRHASQQPTTQYLVYILGLWIFMILLLF